MELPRYEILPKEDLYTFRFISEGKNGEIQKVIYYEEIAEGVFNLALGDEDPATGIIDDKVVTNNGDTEKVLATVIQTVYAFTNSNPIALIYVIGSTHSRNRLYRKGITKYLTQALKDFIIFGELENNEFELFNPTTDYIGFLIQRKIEQLWT